MPKSKETFSIVDYNLHPMTICCLLHTVYTVPTIQSIFVAIFIYSFWTNLSWQPGSLTDTLKKHRICGNGKHRLWADGRGRRVLRVCPNSEDERQIDMWFKTYKGRSSRQKCMIKNNQAELEHEHMSPHILTYLLQYCQVYSVLFAAGLLLCFNASDLGKNSMY